MLFDTLMSYIPEPLRKLIKNLTLMDDFMVLPVTVAKNNVRCLDYDMDNVTFVGLKDQKISIHIVYPEHTRLEMEHNI
jgi:hypothetical protein